MIDVELCVVLDVVGLLCDVECLLDGFDIDVGLGG